MPAEIIRRVVIPETILPEAFLPRAAVLAAASWAVCWAEWPAVGSTTKWATATREAGMPHHPINPRLAAALRWAMTPVPDTAAAERAAILAIVAAGGGAFGAGGGGGVGGGGGGELGAGGGGVEG